MPRIALAYLREDRIAPYLDALAACGVDPARVERVTPARTDAAALPAMAGAVSGLLLTGGVDLQPCLYGEARDPAAGLDPPVPERDQMEWDLLVHARARRLPVFGICRGHQMVNVFLGGALHQDIENATGHAGHGCFAEAGFALDHLAHPVLASSDSHPFARRLRDGGRPLAVNSRHHQAVSRTGPGVIVTATAPDGIIEATALDDPAWWVRTVQWHPENLVDDPAQRGLFLDFLAAAARHAGTAVTPVGA